MSDNKCRKCRCEIRGDAIMTAVDGGKRRKYPICRECHERAVIGAGRSLARVDRFYEPDKHPPPEETE